MTFNLVDIVETVPVFILGFSGEGAKSSAKFVGGRGGKHPRGNLIYNLGKTNS